MYHKKLFIFFLGIIYNIYILFISAEFFNFHSNWNPKVKRIKYELQWMKERDD